jgi:hypothetical protein
LIDTISEASDIIQATSNDKLAEALRGLVRDLQDPGNTAEELTKLSRIYSANNQNVTSAVADMLSQANRTVTATLRLTSEVGEVNSRISTLEGQVK